MEKAVLSTVNQLSIGDQLTVCPASMRWTPQKLLKIVAPCFPAAFVQQSIPAVILS
jgi:hypothetical protein